MLGILDLNRNIYNFLVDFSFIRHACLWVLPLKYTTTEGKLYFENLLGILDFSENIYKSSVDLSFIKHVFPSVIPLKFAG